MNRLIILLTLVLGAQAPSAWADDGERVWNFRVMLDKREIGEHEFRVNRDGDVETATISAEFKVKILFFNAYQYQHQNTETWQNGCLKAIDALTNDNGKPFRVKRQVEEACVQTYAYWNPGILGAERLLNSQTGIVEDVSVRLSGPDTLTINEQEVNALQYVLNTPNGDIVLWYAADSGLWLALEAPAKGGRVIRYEPISLPAPAGQAALAMETITP